MMHTAVQVDQIGEARMHRCTDIKHDSSSCKRVPEFERRHCSRSAACNEWPVSTVAECVLSPGQLFVSSCRTASRTLAVILQNHLLGVCTYTDNLLDAKLHLCCVQVCAIQGTQAATHTHFSKHSAQGDASKPSSGEVHPGYLCSKSIMVEQENSFGVFHKIVLHVVAFNPSVVVTFLCDLFFTLRR